MKRSKRDLTDVKREKAEKELALASSRRKFLGKTLMALSGLALADVLRFPLVADPLAPSSPPFRPGEITRNAAEKKLRAVLQIKNGLRTIPGTGTGRMLRYFEGYNPSDRKPVPAPGGIGPGPTLRARVGDSVEITFLNTANISDFQQTPDKAEAAGCDIVTGVYPGKDTPPNCFHGSSTANLHFHGTHITPNGLGDNVLVQVIPDQDTREENWADLFKKVFHAAPSEFQAMPAEWWQRQQKLVREYDERVRKGAEASGRPLPTPLLPLDEEQIKHGLWPEYVVGAYPNCFKITEYVSPAPGKKPKYEMAQAPGTHWYHAHKHGSTSLHLFNGLAGAFIIEGAYDDDLKKFYKDGIVENVLVLQQITDQQNLMTPSSAGAGNIFVNGQLTPSITMQPGEMQLWRVVNATVSQTLDDFFRPVPNFEFRQIAQDGVQFSWENYKPTAPHPKPRLQLAPGNRVDVLVKAPDAPGSASIGTKTRPRMLTVNVIGTQMGMKFPEKQEDYPKFPKEFLADIPADDLRTRCLSFGWEAGRTGAFRPAPRFTIDGVQFNESRIDQYLTLGFAEEWTLYNYTSIPHPFHIHVNPFQVVEVFDPNSPDPKYVPKANFVWQDVINIPGGLVKDRNLVLDDKGYAATPGYVKVRHRFVDFPGTFVLHCHILAHEDRGMMQLVTVVDPRTVLIRHH